jgi:hypothetical protein
MLFDAILGHEKTSIDKAVKTYPKVNQSSWVFLVTLMLNCVEGYLA